MSADARTAVRREPPCPTPSFVHDGRRYGAAFFRDVTRLSAATRSAAGQHTRALLVALDLVDDDLVIRRGWPRRGAAFAPLCDCLDAALDWQTAVYVVIGYGGKPGVAARRELTASALAEMRALIFELRPDALADEGLVAAVTRQAAALSARTGFSITVAGPGGVWTGSRALTRTRVHNPDRTARCTPGGGRVTASDHRCVADARPGQHRGQWGPGGRPAVPLRVLMSPGGVDPERRPGAYQGPQPACCRVPAGWCPSTPAGWRSRSEWASRSPSARSCRARARRPHRRAARAPR